MATDAEKLVLHFAFIPWMVVWCIVYDLFYNLPTGGDVVICYLKDSLLWTHKLKVAAEKMHIVDTKFHLGFIGLLLFDRQLKW